MENEVRFELYNDVDKISYRVSLANKQQALIRRALKDELVEKVREDDIDVVLCKPDDSGVVQVPIVCSIPRMQKSISRGQCVLTYGPFDVKIVDGNLTGEKSKNGTEVNGELILTTLSTTLRDGDYIGIGLEKGYKLQYRRID